MGKAASRSFTLGVPIANEEERVVFQRRLSWTGLAVFSLSFGFFVLTFAILTGVNPARLRYLFTDTSSRVHLATSFAAGALWLLLRRGKASLALLSALDIVAGAGLCVGWTAMLSSGTIPLEERPEMIALLACTFTLTSRAALIPSTPTRTALIAVLGLVPLVVATHYLYPGVAAEAATAKADGEKWLPPILNVAIWGVLAVAASTIISHIVYGLRQQVRKAMQLGQYLLEEKIGEGGMGVVYRASHAMLRRPTAIKLLNATASTERFEREVQITARLTHPNTIAVFDYGRTPEGVFYYAMEYLDGISLDELVTEFGAQPARRVAHVLLQMCGALGEAHAAGLVHRDIKPANVMLTERGGVLDVVKVLDFGLVKESATGPDATRALAASAVNTILGTPHYMAPETILDPTGIDGRADLYAVGATAYYLLTGDHVFDGSNLVEICSHHLNTKPAPPSTKRAGIPAALDEVVLACLAKKAADRPKDAVTLAAMIRACALGEWLPEEAQAWWTARHGNVNAQAQASKVSAFGKTIAVSLDGRDLSASEESFEGAGVERSGPRASDPAMRRGA